MRSFIFSIWVHSGKVASATLLALETLSSKQYSVAEQGGRQVIAASVQGKSFSYQLPVGQSGSDFLILVHQSWRMLKIGGATNGEMTDAELLAFVSDVGGEDTDRTVASFTQTTR
tara:strand:- start:1179 stop:1523 length:345 start_codon:yes stop_codon:yes gene_type:complete